MTVESATKAAELNTSYPTDADNVSEGAAHIRLTKEIVKGMGTGIPLTTRNSSYTFVATDAGGGSQHTDGTPRTWTIPANASVAYDVGVCLVFVNAPGAATLSIAITSDTMTLANSTSTGTRSLAAAGVAVAMKISSTAWLISGQGLS